MTKEQEKEWTKALHEATEGKLYAKYKLGITEKIKDGSHTKDPRWGKVFFKRKDDEIIFLL